MNKIARVHIKVIGLIVFAAVFALIPHGIALTVVDSTVDPSYGFWFIMAALAAALRFITDSYDWVKRGCDIVISVFALAVAAPVVGVLALLIKILSPEGAVIYRQVRVGRYGRLFTVYKLRSMHPDAEKMSGAVWANAESDPREIKWLGGFLRKSHLDEVPQFFNVLRGDMSIVGPRPERPELVEKLKRIIPDYDKRLCAVPGITGLAQVFNKYDKTLRDVRRKIKLDLLYMKKRSIFFDVHVMALTVIVMFKGTIITRSRARRIKPVFNQAVTMQSDVSLVQSGIQY